MKLWNKNLIMVLVGQIISLFGNAIIRFALPLYLLNETGSAALFGLVSASAFIPMLVLMPIGGILADRINKRNIMVVLDFVTAFITFAFMVSLGKTNLVILTCITLILLYGIQGTYQPTVQASIPLLVPQENIMQGNAMINLVSSVSNLLGPIIGGVLFSLIGIKPILVVSIVCFLASAIMEIFIVIPFVKQKSEKNVFAVGIGDLKESLHFIFKKRREILEISLIITALNLLLSACVMIGLPIVVTKSLGFSLETGNQLYGYAQGIMGAGSLVGGITAGLIAKKIKVRQNPWLLMACGATLVPIAIALALPIDKMSAYVVVVASSFVMMTICTIFSIQMISYLQMLTPTNLLGKVISCAMCIGMCASPIGQAIFGVLFQVLEKTPQYVFAGAFVLITLVSLVSIAGFKRMDDLIRRELKMSENEVYTECELSV